MDNKEVFVLSSVPLTHIVKCILNVCFSQVWFWNEILFPFCNRYFLFCFVLRLFHWFKESSKADTRNTNMIQLLGKTERGLSSITGPSSYRLKFSILVDYTKLRPVDFRTHLSSINVLTFSASVNFP